jgi:esterase/lipase superfamily enzyme
MGTMLMVSCRRDFWSPTDFSTTDEIRRVDLDSGRGTPVSQTEFLQELRSKRLTVLTHGYNNEERDVVDSYGTIDRRMRQLGFLGASGSAYDALVGFAWPGGAVGVSFPFARQRAGESASRFARLLAELRSTTAVIDINSHSLGAHVALEALRGGGQRLVRNAWNFAAAVDNESIEDGERYFEASRRCERFYVFHSRNDPVLRVWYRVGDLPNFDTALGYSGPEDPGAIIKHSKNVRVVNCKDVVQSHGGYRSSGQVWAYMSQQLTRPSSLQFVTLARDPQALSAEFRMAGGSPGRASRASSSTRSRASARGTGRKAGRSK